MQQGSNFDLPSIWVIAVLMTSMKSLTPCSAVAPVLEATMRHRSHAHSPVWRHKCRCARGHAQSRAALHGDVGLVLEADTVVVDMHDAVHRPAFNRAFESLGLSCANWSSRIYYEIRRGGDGTATGLVRAYFDTVGWPMVVTEAERKPFAMQVVKAKDRALQEMLQEGEVPLRDGVAKLIDDALAAEAGVGLLCGTVSQKEENIGSAISFALGVHRAQHIQLVSTWDDDLDSDHPQSPTSSLAAEAAKAQAKVKQQEAAAFSRSMKGVGVDPNILASSRQLEPHHLVRLSNRLGIPSAHCAFVGATELTLQAGRAAGMLAVSVPTALAGRFKPPSAQLSFDGFGPGGGVTWTRISQHLRNIESS